MKDFKKLIENDLLINNKLNNIKKNIINRPYSPDLKILIYDIVYKCIDEYRKFNHDRITTILIGSSAQNTAGSLHRRWYPGHLCPRSRLIDREPGLCNCPVDRIIGATPYGCSCSSRSRFGCLPR